MTGPTWLQESALAQAGYTRVAGIDEAGRGAWAGPVVAAAVILDPATVEMLTQAGVRDSKQLSPARRATLYDVVQDRAWAVGVGIVPPAVIDQAGIVPATRQAMQEAVAQLVPAPDHLLIDFVTLPAVRVPQRAIVKGDQHCLAIAAASIIAKVTRDRLMVALDAQHPGYGLAQHKGYGTLAHRTALNRQGACSAHRRTFEPIRRILAGEHLAP
ncbi:MAG: ribonuclease HII [Chloroflexi bacterium]|nr:ribonuclease HII [Chloroflexota bacterium]MBU1749068.1 ribonuclease HII [Chloroflexota bacterium]MBU1877849.1 ribonuclease HII [Chloroflexota bacterium]